MAEYQEFSVDREGFFGLEDPEEQRMHHFKHVHPPVSGELLIIDDMQTRFSVGQIENVERSVLREIEVALPASVRTRVSASLGGENSLIMWVIENPEANPSARYPSDMIRVVQDQYVKARVSNRSGSHTLHWHGIEPSSMNDGVGKHSFEIEGQDIDGTEVGGEFTYQFHPHQAGTFFFHCHKNTVHHFEMGMFGMLIVDPPAPSVDDDPRQEDTLLNAPYVTGAAGYAAGRLDTDKPFDPDDLNLIRYDQEKYWVADDMDAAWHNLVDDHTHNMQDMPNIDDTGQMEDPMDPLTFHVYGTNGIQLNDFQPDIFAVTGVFLDYGETGPGGDLVDTFPHYFGTIDNPLISVNVDVQTDGHKKILIRFLNASYSLIDMTLPVDSTVIAMGGIPLGATDRTKYSRPYILPAGARLGSITARRFDLIIDTENLGDEVGESISDFATLDYYDWVKGRPGGKRAEIRIPINITNIVT